MLHFINKNSHCAIWISAALIVLLGGKESSGAARFTLIERQGGNLLLSVSELGTNSHTLQVSSNLLNWIDDRVVQGAAGTAQVTVPLASAIGARFFRLVQSQSASPIPVWPAGSFLTARSSNNVVQLSWPAATDDGGIASYNLYYQGQLLTNLGANALSFGMSTLPSPSNHFFRVEAVDRSGNKSTNNSLMSALATLRNEPPVGLRDFGATTVGAATQINLLANDLDENGDALRVAEVIQPTNGTVVLQGSTAVYTPNPGFSGRDVFFYTLSDRAAALSAAATAPANPLKVVIHVAALEALLVDQPAGTNQFAELAEAISWLKLNLQPNQAGRVKIRTRRALAVSTLNLDRDIHIMGENGPANLAGSTVTVNAGFSLSLSGTVISATGGLFFNVSGYLDLINNQFDAADTIVNGGGASPAGTLRIQAQTPLLDVNLQANQYQNLSASLQVACGGDVDIAQGRGLTLQTDATLDCNSKMRVAYERVNSFKLTSTLQGNSSTHLTGLNGLTEIDGKVHAIGRNELTSHNTFAGTLKLEVDGVGEATARLSGVRHDQTQYRASSGTFEHDGDGNIYGGLDLRLAGPAGIRGSADFLEKGSRFRLGATVDVVEGITGKVGAEYSTFDENLTLNAGGKFEGSLGFVDIAQTLELTARAGTDDSAGLQVQNATVGGETDLSVLGRKILNFRAEHVVHDRDLRIQGATTATLNIDLLEVFLGDGSRGGSSSRQSHIMIDGQRTGGPFGSLSANSASVRSSAANEQIRIRNARLIGNAPIQLFEPPIIQIFGGHAPVLIESNRFDRAGWIVVSEVEAPVTIRKNNLKGKGISLDGDIEGSGISGLRPDPWVVDDNDIEVTGLGGTALTIQDLRDAIVQNNRFTINQPGSPICNISAAKVAYISNSVISSLDAFEQMPMVVTRAANGIGIVNANGNIFRGTILLGPSGYGTFTNNTFDQGIVTLFQTAMGVFRGNQFSESELDAAMDANLDVQSNTFADSSISLGLNAYGIIQGNTFSGGIVEVGPNGVARVSGNSFSNSTVSDELPNGGLVLAPGASNSGLDPEADIFSDGDWSGNGCADYPPGCNEKIDNMCGCDGFPPPADRALPPFPSL